MDTGISVRRGRPQVRATKKTGWTKARQVAFLDHLAATCNVSAASREVGLSIQSAYALRRPDPLFAARWAAAIEAAYEVPESALLARAMGTDAETETELPMPDVSRAKVTGFDQDLALGMRGRHAPGHRHAPGIRGRARTVYKQVPIEEVWRALATKLDALERRLAKGGSAYDYGGPPVPRPGETGA